MEILELQYFYNWCTKGIFVFKCIFTWVCKSCIYVIKATLYRCCRRWELVTRQRSSGLSDLALRLLTELTLLSDAQQRHKIFHICGKNDMCSGEPLSCVLRKAANWRTLCIIRLQTGTDGHFRHTCPQQPMPWCQNCGMRQIYEFFKSCWLKETEWCYENQTGIN